jgi:hypothetical protein
VVLLGAELTGPHVEILSQAFRSGVAPVLFVLIACRNTNHGDARADTARLTADSSRPPAAIVPSARDTVTLSDPHAGAPPVLVVGTATIVLDSTSLAQVQAALGATAIVGDKTGINGRDASPHGPYCARACGP